MNQRQRILEAAIELFGQKGYERVSLRQLAQAVGLTPPTLYHYFPTKEALLETLAHQVAEKFELATAGIAESNWEVTHKLERFCEAHLIALLEKPLQATIFLREAPQHLSEPQRSAFLTRQRQYESRVERILEEGLQKNLFREIEPRFVAVSLLAALNATATWYQPGGPMKPVEIGNKIAEIFIRGLIRSW
ncbi:MAG: TetR/AcrR family transcriptional regulator [Bacteroidia bacterium]|nr:TetR/AcrR family transcriptional regulator [Bacteroidia bacterium]MDW8133761.1 TetR/AcrR family transcriptional regulator [Bacteroidia bacterium]